MRALAGVPRVLTPLALLAAALALIVPSSAVAARSDVLLALLVLATALGIPFADLRRLRDHATDVAVLSVAPLVLLGAVAWVIGRPFATPIRDGLLAVGLSSSEVASVGLVALAGADATIALGAVSGSLVASALIGPLAIGALAGASAHADPLPLLARFALVVIVPLIVGVAVRSRRPRIAATDPEREGIAALTVAALIYAALSGTHGAHHLGAALLASLAFLAVSAVLAELWRRRTGRSAGGTGGGTAGGPGGGTAGGTAGGPGGRRSGGTAVPGAFAIAMRDFAVAAALATQAFGTSAAAVPGVYGVVMLVGGAIAAGRRAGGRGPG